MNRFAKVIAAAVAITATLTMTATADFVYSKMIEEVVLVKDEEGTEYVVTHRVDREGSELVEYYENVPVEIINQTSDDIVEIYISDAERTDWGENWMSSLGEDAVIPAGGNAYLTMNYAKGNLLLDVKLVLSDGNDLVFNKLNLNDLTGATHFQLTVYPIDDDGNYTLDASI